VFHSPNDDDTSPPAIETLAPGSHTLHLYVETGSTASSSGPCDVGDGEEICQWVIDARGEGGVSFQSFTPVGDVNWNLEGQLLTATGGDYVSGDLGVFKIGDLAIVATDAGSVALIHGEVALADLSVASVESGDLVLLPEPSRWLLQVTGICFLAVLCRVRNRRIRSFRQSAPSVLHVLPAVLFCLTLTGAADAAGPVVGWGYDYYGQATPPDAVNGVSGTATDVATAYIHTLAIALPEPSLWLLQVAGICFLAVLYRVRNRGFRFPNSRHEGSLASSPPCCSASL
jgi:hypothetical protein